jgi:hypothetical protein
MKKLIRAAIITLSGSATVAAVYLLAICWPQPFFRYSLRCGNLYLHSTAPLPGNTEYLLREVQRRLAASPLYNVSLKQHIFICGNSAQFAFFTNVSFRSSALTYAYFNRSVFLRPSDVAHNVLFNYSGSKVTDDRMLVYYMAHELTHSLMVSYIGPWRYHELPQWLREGYADYIGKGSDSFRDIQAKFEDSSYRTNREYLRYELMTAYLLEVRKVGLRDLVSGDYDANFAAAQQYIHTLKQ